MTSTDDLHVGQLVRDIRLFRGWTPQALADTAQVDVKTIRSLENGQRWPQDTTQRKIEHALQIPAGTIGIAQQDRDYRGRFFKLLRKLNPSPTLWLDPDEQLHLDVDTGDDKGQEQPTVAEPSTATVKAEHLATMVELSFLADDLDSATDLELIDPSDADEVETYIEEVEDLKSAAEYLIDAVHQAAVEAAGGDVSRLRQIKREIRRRNQSGPDIFEMMIEGAEPAGDVVRLPHWGKSDPPPAVIDEKAAASTRRKRSDQEEDDHDVE
ncbi:helix-turn-helix transcriptional regulator [Mycobacterium sp. 852013-50091_SCH5140682]|uniref:helix-turn-helix domain-containing protein n=1 Tax=Mycobacterium sp. 852013-50091_SCH5140682 TaxID=1834109 RepID=UPI0018D3AB58|nr:helix-turn-helix transcriptional regulator [Mycobacterium sp. 852013-50091_SCH5140682]